MGRACVTLATDVSGYVSDRTRKDKETLKAVLVEKPERTNARGVQLEFRSGMVHAFTMMIQMMFSTLCIYPHLRTIAK